VTNKGKRVVVNTSPWIALSICGQVSLLEKLYTDVYIPSIKPSITRILDNGIWIKDEIVNGILKDAGEK